MTAGHALSRAIKALEAAHIPGAHLDAELLMAHVLGRDRAWLIAHDDTELDEPQLEQFHALINRREAREPVVHLTGHREFYGLEFAITPDVLTPRTETEQMVDWAIKYAPIGSRLIDIGTGSGAIAIAIAKHRPDLSVTATEVSEAALNVARGNAQTHGVTVNFVLSDLWDRVEGTYQTIVTNLPYLRNDADLMAEVRREPGVALFGGEDGLDLYREFLRKLPLYLEKNGFVFTECDPWQHENLTAEAANAGLTPIEQGYFILGFKRLA